MALIEVNVDIMDKSIEDKLDSLVDDRTMLQIHDLLAKMCDPYVPFLEGPLSQTNEVTPQGVRYVQPYARYQYYGTEFNHTIDVHPLASAMWDKAMLRDHGDEFRVQVHDILRRRAKELGY